MDNIIYDVFISYRRNGGFDTAGRINDLLVQEGYSVSYDIDTLREGRFDKQLLERIEQCVDFILIVDKNAFVRTLDSTISPEDDWLRQELAYALKLRKNVIPVLLAGAEFPKHLPEEIDEVRFRQGPKHTNEYFDSFYQRLKSYMHALRRNTPSADVHLSVSAQSLPKLKIKSDMDCVFYLDGEETAHIKTGIIEKYPLLQGEYELKFVSTENKADIIEIEFEMPAIDKLKKVCLKEIRDKRLQKEAEERKAQEERIRQEEEEERKRKEIANGLFTANGVSFRMICVEGGTFQMGSNESDACKDERPVRLVTLNNYYIGQTEVTQALWQAVMDGNPSKFQGDGQLPIESISWEDCQTFIKKLNQLTGQRFRLPTEAEWEYAARGGKYSKGYKYSGSNTLGDVAWYTDNSGGKTHPVASKHANELGLYDMSGNVEEWCQDWYGTYPSSSQINPTGPNSGSCRLHRGGSWNNYYRSCRISLRSESVPLYQKFNLGLRLAMSSISVKK